MSRQCRFSLVDRADIENAFYAGNTFIYVASPWSVFSVSVSVSVSVLVSSSVSILCVCLCLFVSHCLCRGLSLCPSQSLSQSPSLAVSASVPSSVLAVASPLSERTHTYHIHRWMERERGGKEEPATPEMLDKMLSVNDCEYPQFRAEV